MPVKVVRENTPEEDAGPASAYQAPVSAKGAVTNAPEMYWETPSPYPVTPFLPDSGGVASASDSEIVYVEED